MSEHVHELAIDSADELGRLAEAAAGGEVVYLTRCGCRVAAIVPAAVAAAGTAAIEAYEDAEDARISLEAHAEWKASGRMSYPLDEVLAEFGTRHA